MEKRLKHTAILGAAGKMGRGIAELILQQMAINELEETGAVGNGMMRLVLIDPDQESLYSLRKQLRPSIIRFAEKSINRLRKGYQKNRSLVSNGQMIEAFVTGALDSVHLTPNLEEAKQATLVFEAVVEDVSIKKDILKQIGQFQPDSWVLSNTSSIPIQRLEQDSGLKGRIVGFHFYNPPPKQKLVEVVFPDDCDETLKSFAIQLGQDLKKIVVESADIPGFIGNGHMIREILFACELAEEIQGPEGIVKINSITKNLLVRPMGIFQLIDFVGIDVVLHIIRTMGVGPATLLERVFDKGKKTFFRYEEGKEIAVLDLEQDQYIDIPKDWIVPPLSQVGSWKEWTFIKHPEEKLVPLFQSLFEQDSLPATLAKRYLVESNRIANELVKNGVARTKEDVETVLKEGFHHLYHPESILGGAHERVS